MRQLGLLFEDGPAIFNGALAKYKESLSYDVPGKYDYRHRLAQYLVGVAGPV